MLWHFQKDSSKTRTSVCIWAAGTRPRQRQWTTGVFPVRLRSLWSPMFTKKTTQNKQNGTLDSLYIHTWWLGQGSLVRDQSIFTHLYLKMSCFCVPNGCEFETLLRDADVVKTSSHILHILLERKCSAFPLRWLLFSSICADSFI